MMATELKDSVLRSAMAIILGGGLEGGRTVGMESYLRLVGDYLRDYLALCDWLGGPRADRLNPSLAKYLED